MKNIIIFSILGIILLSNVTFAQVGIITERVCVDNQSIQQTTLFYTNNKLQNITFPPTNCAYGCDTLNNICNPNPTTQNYIFIGIILGILLAVILLIRLCRR